MGNHSIEGALRRLSKKEAGECKLILSINNLSKGMKHGEQMVWDGSISEKLNQRTVLQPAL